MEQRKLMGIWSERKKKDKKDKEVYKKWKSRYYHINEFSIHLLLIFYRDQFFVYFFQLFNFQFHWTCKTQQGIKSVNKWNIKKVEIEEKGIHTLTHTHMHTGTYICPLQLYMKLVVRIWKWRFSSLLVNI